MLCKLNFMPLEKSLEDASLMNWGIVLLIGSEDFLHVYKYWNHKVLAEKSVEKGIY